MNRLAGEKSPYLLQHADNPVDWYPWGEEAFNRAKKEDKPVFLSVGYATCHWCHVMAHESFEDEEVARLMNRAFINIKVDREERPDIDNTYMTVCQMITGQGGWPLTIIMTPEKEPFYAATYLPKQSHPHRIGMLQLVPAIEDAWKNDRERILESADQIKNGFSKTLQLGKSTKALADNITEQAVQSLKQRYDEENGGFGGAPKFPSPHNLIFLLNHSHLKQDDMCKKMVSQTLDKMRFGGIWDHVGGGFHRYSTDEKWLLPHFEKMLYDQALMLRSYAEGWIATGNELFNQTCHGIVSYLDECLTSPEGAFFSAEDADSEGEEGKFYVWKKEDIEQILNADDAGLFCKMFNISDEGNFYDEATRQKTGANIPHLTEPVPGTYSERIETILNTLHKHRSKRVRPLLDDKVLTDWNGLMIASLARSGVLLEDHLFIERAERAMEFILSRMITPERQLLHRWRGRDADIIAMADDYVFLIEALIQLYQATFKPEYLKQALELQNRFDRDFADDEHGGWYFTPETGEMLLGRQKEIYDGAMPSSNSVAAMNSFLLSRLTGIPGFEERGRSVFRAFSESISDTPAGYTGALNARQLMDAKTSEILISSPEFSSECEDAIRVSRVYAPPGSVILLKLPALSEALAEVSSFSASYPEAKKLTIYACSNFTCKAPVHSAGELENILSE